MFWITGKPTIPPLLQRHETGQCFGETSRLVKRPPA